MNFYYLRSRLVKSTGAIFVGLMLFVSTFILLARVGPRVVDSSAEQMILEFAAISPVGILLLFVMLRSNFKVFWLCSVLYANFVYQLAFFTSIPEISTDLLRGFHLLK
jgi:hypothetical protein